MRVSRNICIGLVSLLAVLPMSLTAQGTSADVWRSCIVSQETPDGTWIASRSITDSNATIRSTRDHYEWEAKEVLTFGQGMTLEWDISYYWQVDVPTQRRIPEQEVMVSLHFKFEPQADRGPLRKPERTWLHLYRTSNLENDGVSTQPSLIDMMFWNQYSDGSLSTKAVISLSDLLAYGTGFDALVWHIRSRPNEFGATNRIAKGIFPVVVLRNRLDKIQDLRRLLNKKAAKFRTECDFPATVSVPN